MAEESEGVVEAVFPPRGSLGDSQLLRLARLLDSTSACDLLGHSHAVLLAGDAELAACAGYSREL